MLYTWIVLVEQIFLAHSQFGRANIVNAGFGIARALTVVVACFGFGVDHLLPWAVWNAGLYVGTSLACLGAIWSYGPPRWRLSRDELKLGVTMSGAGFLWALRQNVDILVLSSFETPAVVGAYGVTRRVINTAGILGASFDRQIYAKLVVAGQSGPAATLRLARKYAIYALAITGPTSVVLFAVSPVLPWIFGKDFGEAIPMLNPMLDLNLGCNTERRFRCPKCRRSTPCAIISGTATGLLGSGLVAILTFAYGINGAFIASYLSEAGMALAFWATLIFLSDRPPEQSGEV